MANLAFLSTAHTHTKGFLKTVDEKDNTNLVAIWDDMESRGQAFADQYNSDFSADLDAVISRDDVDGFIICVENTRHLPLLKAAIPTGKPIFCEKPFTTTAAEAAEALALIKEHNTIVPHGLFSTLLCRHARCDPTRYSTSGALGTITHARYRNAHNAAYGRWFDSPELAWFHDPALAGGGAFMDMGTHAVHLMRTVLGPVEKVFATISNKSGIYTTVDDNGVAIFQFANGCVATIEGSWVQTGGLSGIEVVGSEATLFQHPEHGLVTAKPREEPVAVAPGEEKPTRVDRLVAAIEGKVSKEELDADLACAADAVAIMEACYKSNETGGWVDVPSI